MENRMIFDESEKEELSKKIINAKTEFLQKISDIFEILKTIDEDYFQREKEVLVDFLTSALKTLKEKKIDDNDQSEKIQSVSRALGFDFEDYIRKIFESKYEILFRNLENGVPNNDKEVDEETMKFITSDQDIDDYEKFLKETKIKESLSFLSKEI